MQIRNSIPTPEIYPQSPATRAVARCVAHMLVACTLAFAAVSCSVYDSGLLENAPPARDHAIGAAIPDGSVDGGSSCDAGSADADDCAPEEAPPAEPSDDPDPVP